MAPSAHVSAGPAGRQLGPWRRLERVALLRKARGLETAAIVGSAVGRLQFLAQGGAPSCSPPYLATAVVEPAASQEGEQ